MPLRHATASLLLAALWPTFAAAQVPAEPVLLPATLRTQDVPDAQKRPRTVAILPLKNDVVAPGDLFAPEAAAAPDPLPLALEARIQRLLEAAPYVTVLPVERVRRALADDAAAQTLARAAQGRYRLGLDLYLSLATARAADSLQEAAEVYRSIFQDLVDPKPYADAQFMLGVALVDAGRPAEGHIALKDAFQLQPGRRFRANFFPPHVNTALANALIDHQSTADALHPYGENRRMHALATRLGVAWLVLGSLRPGQDGPELHLAVYGAHRRVIEAEVRLPTRDSDARLDAFVSRWLACAPVAEVRPQGHRPSRQLRVDTSGSYALYQRQPTRRDFHSLGFAAGLSGELRPGFEWFGRINMYTSLSDPYRDLLHAFNSVRALGGVGFAFARGPWRWFVRPGLDVHVLGSFATTTDPDCKLFGTDHKLCDRGTLVDLDERVLMGLNLAVGSQVHIGRNLFLALQGSMSTYFVPLDGTDRLNYPISGEIGLGYRL